MIILRELATLCLEISLGFLGGKRFKFAHSRKGSVVIKRLKRWLLGLRKPLVSCAHIHRDSLFDIGNKWEALFSNIFGQMGRRFSSIPNFVHLDWLMGHFLQFKDFLENILNWCNFS